MGEAEFVHAVKGLISDYAAWIIALVVLHALISSDHLRP